MIYIVQILYFFYNFVTLHDFMNSFFLISQEDSKILSRKKAHILYVSIYIYIIYIHPFSVEELPAAPVIHSSHNDPSVSLIYVYLYMMQQVQKLQQA